LQVGDTGPVESARRSNSRVLGSPFSGLSGHYLFISECNEMLNTCFRMHRIKCDGGMVTAGREETNRNENGQPATAATTEGENNIPAAAVLGAPPRSADLISLMREKFSTAIPGEEEEEGGSGGCAPAAGQRPSHTDYANKPGTDSGLRNSVFVSLTANRKEVFNYSILDDLFHCLIV
jgi:hypothetical protein